MENSLELNFDLDYEIPFKESSSDEIINTSYYQNRKKTSVKLICKNLFFDWTRQAMRISNNKSLKIKHLAPIGDNVIQYLFDILYNKWYTKPQNFSDSIHVRKYHQKSLCPLFFTLLSCNKSNVFFVLFLSLLFLLTQFFHINLLRNLIFLFKDNKNIINIYKYAFLFLVNKICSIFLIHHTMFNSQILGINAGNMLSALVYEKIMRTSAFLKGNLSEGEMINYIQIDIDTLGFVFFYAPLTVVVPLQFGLYIYLLFKFFGIIFIFGVIIFLILFMIAWIIQKVYISNQRLLLENKDQRMKLTSNVLHIIKILKLYVWEEEFLNRIDKERIKELKTMKKIQNVYVLSGFVHRSIPLFLAISTIGIFTTIYGKIPIENLLTSIEIFDSMANPLYRFPIFITSLLNCLISMKRIENFLKTNDIHRDSIEDKELKEKNIILKFSKCNFGIKNEETLENKILLNDINIEINKGDMVVILGETGSGKTCLANAILNYLEYIKPTNTTSDKNNKNNIKCQNIINGSISYAPQNPWIMNDTIRNNILFFNELNIEKYKEILQICQLTSDLDNLPGGELTEVSSNGTNISGGQKARISLARAIYKESDIYLFDDPISSVDSINSYEIFNKVLIEHLKGKTRILIRHDIQNLHMMNKIIFMEKGKVIWSGSYKDFIKTDLYKNLVKQVKRKTTLEEERLSQRRKSVRHLREKIPSIGHELDKIEKGKLIKDEEMKQGKISYQLYFKLLKLMGGYSFCFLIVILSIACECSQVGGNVWLMFWSSNKMDNLYAFLVYTELGLLSLFFLFLKEFLFSRALLYINRNLHDQMLTKLFSAPINLFFDIVPIGQCINRLTSDLEKCKLILKLLSQILRSDIILLLAIIVCAHYNIYSLISPPILFFFGFVITNYYISAGRDLNRLDGIARSPIVSGFSESISGAIIIRSFNEQKHFQEKLFKHLNDYYTVINYKFGATNWYSLYLDLSSFIYLFVIVVGACIFHDKFSPEAIGLMLKYSISFSEQMLNALDFTSNLEKSMVNYERCDEYTKIIQEKPREMPRDKLLRNWPNEGIIKIVNYSARYRPETELALNNINLEIKSKEKIGVVGKSGSGKSSLFLAIYRIFESNKGFIYIDNENISNLGLKKLRENLCIVPQDPTLIEGTIRDNIDPLNEYNDKDICNILKELDFFDFIDDNIYDKKFSKSLNFKITEFGNNLSLGKKQLLCFARAILKKSKIIFLDEATASLDQKTEDIIEKIIDKYFKDNTVLTIAHRVQTVKKCDRVIVMDQGKVIEFDKPEILLKKQNSLFASLYYKNLKSLVAS